MGSYSPLFYTQSGVLPELIPMKNLLVYKIKKLSGFN